MTREKHTDQELYGNIHTAQGVPTGEWREVSERYTANRVCSGAAGSRDKVCQSEEGRAIGDMLVESLAQGSVTEGHQI